MDATEVAETVARLAAEIDRDHPDGVVLIGVLKGSLFFLADLARALTVPCEIDFMAISHYAPDSGRVRIVKDLEGDISG
ncbi:MAG TPA: phosphoribosyltransferase family protein, partial [Acidimicrobiia bacterium]|nr:phosphoribosyltransferase family protein [Acidimicrobiia bacterium]